MPFADRMMLTQIEQSPEGTLLSHVRGRAVARGVAREGHDGFAFVTYERKR
jgi:hypothetical protein